MEQIVKRKIKRREARNLTQSNNRTISLCAGQQRDKIWKKKPTRY